MLLVKIRTSYVCTLAGKIWIKLKLRSLLLCICPCVICNYINVFSCLHLPRIDWCASLPDTIVLWPTEVSWGLYSIPLIEANPRIEISLNIPFQSFQPRHSCICSYLSSITIRRKPSLKFHSIVNRQSNIQFLFSAFASYFRIIISIVSLRNRNMAFGWGIWLSRSILVDD